MANVEASGDQMRLLETIGDPWKPAETGGDNVMHISMFRNYSFNFGRNVAKHGRNMERRRERNIAEPKFELKSFHPSSCIFYGCGRI